MASLSEFRSEHPDIAADFTIPQHWERYSAAEHGIWRTLYKRQAALLPGRACVEFLDGLGKLELVADQIPDFELLSEQLMRLTGWRVVAVPSLVPDDVFFDHLANRRFPAGRFIRRPEQLDYIEEPDVFHDVFGHVPMLAHPVFADYMQAYGKGGQRALSEFGALNNLARLYPISENSSNRLRARRNRWQQIQAQLATRTVEATSGGGAVKVVAKCDGTVTSHQDKSAGHQSGGRAIARGHDRVRRQSGAGTGQKNLERRNGQGHPGLQSARLDVTPPWPCPPP